MVKAALARVLFGLHTLVTVWKVVSQVTFLGLLSLSFVMGIFFPGG